MVKYHRTIGTTLNTLIQAGFTVQAVEEFAPSAEQIEASPELQEETERPMMLFCILGALSLSDIAQKAGLMQLEIESARLDAQRKT